MLAACGHPVERRYPKGRPPALPTNDDPSRTLVKGGRLSPQPLRERSSP